MVRPTLSVIMPNYNHGHFVRQALQALLDQSRPASEIIFIDDASTDHSLDVVRPLAERHPTIKLIENPSNRGVNYNLARALEIATGDYVVGAACDDQILPGFFERSLGLLARHPEAGLCSSLSRVMDEGGADLGLLPAMVVSDVPCYLPPRETRRILRSFGNWMQGNTTIYRREALVEAGGFRPELHSFSDNFVSQVLALKHGACFVPEALCAWRRMNNTYSATCVADPEVGRQISRNSADLMRREYRDLFPRGYARDWEREMAFDRAKTSYLRRSSPEGPGPGPAGRPSGKWDRLRIGLAMFYLMAKHRPALKVRRRLKMLLTVSARRLARAPRRGTSPPPGELA